MSAITASRFELTTFYLLIMKIKKENWKFKIDLNVTGEFSL